MKKLITFIIAVLFCAIFAAFFQTNSQAQNLTEKESRKQENFARLIEKAERRGVARVIVGFKGDFQAEGFLEESERGNQQRKIKTEQENFLNRHAARRLDKVKKFDSVPFLAFEADSPALRQIQADGGSKPSKKTNLPNRRWRKARPKPAQRPRGIWAFRAADRPSPFSTRASIKPTVF